MVAGTGEKQAKGDSWEIRGVMVSGGATDIMICITILK